MPLYESSITIQIVDGGAMDDSCWLKIYKRLASFDGNLPSGVLAIEERYFYIYHNLLTELEKLSGLSLGDFVISDSHLMPVKVLQGATNNKVIYSDQRFIDNNIIRAKLKDLASYFDKKFAEI